MLFSTLDSTTRKLTISQRHEVLISDTVGFIEKLPHQLIAAFKSTLEEVVRSDLLLLIIDVSNQDFEKHLISVRNVLDEIGVHDKKIVLVFNKIDKATQEKIHMTKLKFRDAQFISAKTGEGLPELLISIKDILEKSNIRFTITIPYKESKLTSYVFDNCNVIEKRYENEGVTMLVVCSLDELMRIKKDIGLKKADAKIKILDNDLEVDKNI
jgi:GTP-binding protein HflX